MHFLDEMFLGAAAVAYSEALSSGKQQDSDFIRRKAYAYYEQGLKEYNEGKNGTGKGSRQEAETIEDKEAGGEPRRQEAE